MRGINSLEMFYVGAALLIMAPGPDFVYVVTQGIARGRWSGVLSAVGISLGLLVHTTLAALGLTALILTSPLLFDVIKYLGAAYLVFLGVKSFRNHGLVTLSAVSLDGGAVQIVRQGLFTNLFNPKAMLTFLAFIPQFISPGVGSVFLGGSMAFLGIVWFSIVGYFSGLISEWVLNSRANRLISYLMGFVLISLGIRLVVAA
jgi:threonine/homoserine/homoserine lactone efflux protein